MRKLKRSVEFDQYRRSLKCPQCDCRSIVFREGVGDVVTNLEFKDRLLLEHPISKLEGRLESVRFLGRMRQANHDRFGGIHVERFRRDSEIECEECGGRWPVFFRRPLGFTITRVHEPKYFEKELHTTSEDMDGGPVDTIRRKMIRKTVAYSFGVQQERVRTVRTGGSVSASAPLGPAKISARLNQEVTDAIKMNLSAMVHKELTVEHSLEVPVPAGQSVKLLITYVEQWREVVYEVAFSDGVTVEVPVQDSIELLWHHKVV